MARGLTLRFGLLALLGFSALVIAAPQRFQGHPVVRVEVTNEKDLSRIEELGGIILNCNPGVGAMDVVIPPDRVEALRLLGRRSTVLVEDVQALLDLQEQQRAAVVGTGDPFQDFFLGYHPYDGIGGVTWYLDELAARYPTLATKFDIGTTLQGRTIWGIRVTGGLNPSKPAVVYFGCEHAREWITTTTPSYLARHLLENYGTDPAITDLVDNVEFYLIPVFNVDGYIYTWTNNRMWRKNLRASGSTIYGVDINRNWGQGWGGPGSSGVTTSETYRGASAFSEPETQRMRDFFINHPNVRAQLDIHSYSQLILWPWGYTSTLPTDQGYYEQIGYAMQALIFGVHSTSYAAGPVYSTIYPASGVSVDWTYAQRGVLSYSFECRDTGAYGFLLPPAQIIPQNEELLPAMLHLTDSDWVRSALRYEFPNGVPNELAAGVETAIDVRIIPQTETVAAGGAQLYYRYDPADAFGAVPLTSLGADDYRAVLPATSCASTPEFYFSTLGSGGSLTLSPRQAPVGGVYSAGMTTGVSAFYSEMMDADPGWSVEGQWAFGTPAGGGGQGGAPDPTSGHTGSGVYGYNLAGDYSDNMPVYYLTTPAVDCSGQTGVRLSFWRWLGVESPSWDHATVEVSSDGIQWTTVWQNAAEVAEGTWTLQTIDISGVADNRPTVYLRWGMGPTDTSVVYCGWNIDDVVLYGRVCVVPGADCNENGVDDAQDVAGETSPDCDADGVPDECQIDAGSVAPGGPFFCTAGCDPDCNDTGVPDACELAGNDTNANGVPDECDCTAPPPLETAFTQNVDAAMVLDLKGRFLTFSETQSGFARAVRVKFVALPAAYSVYSGTWAWVQIPQAVSELPGKGFSDAPGTDPTFMAARLGDTPAFTDWSAFGEVHVYDERIVPSRRLPGQPLESAQYDVQTVPQECSVNVQGNFSAALHLATARWGDIAQLADGQFRAADGEVGVDDLLAAVAKFGAAASATSKTRADLVGVEQTGAAPALDGKVTVGDLLAVVDAFTGGSYPFVPPPP